MDEQRRAKIEPIHLEEAAKLRAIYERVNAGPNKLSQLAFGQQFDIGTQGMVWQYLNGKSALNLDAALKFARGLQCEVADFSPRLAASLKPPAARAPLAPETHEPGARPFIDRDTIAVQVFDARASMGAGFQQPEHDTVVDTLRLARGWVRAQLPALSSSNNLAVLSAYGDSMAPTFADGDVLLVDRGVHDIRLDAVYVLALNNELYVKRIQRRITDGAVIIKSDNPLYDPVVVENGERAQLRVLGRVVWAWNGRRL
ncbi:MAG: helix-turn-helix transcriptional regulator [Pseudomonadales bacterium]|nr:helix-turn-helix transcriptional regulator [Pseudomonadales bacterium]